LGFGGFALCDSTGVYVFCFKAGVHRPNFTRHIICLCNVAYRNKRSVGIASLQAECGLGDNLLYHDNCHVPADNFPCVLYLCKIKRLCKVFATIFAYSQNGMYEQCPCKKILQGV